MVTNKKLTKNDHYILFDFGAQIHNYCGDLSRTVFFGEVTNSIKNQYIAVLKAQENALKSLILNHTPRSTSSIDLAARKYLKTQGYSIPHAVGHGIGIAVHEAPSVSPKSKNTLQANMVITIEPGIYVKNKGGIRIEDTVLITENGYKLLTHSSKEFIVL
jgi:Xaa-Pro aminopeptidase